MMLLLQKTDNGARGGTNWGNGGLSWFVGLHKPQTNSNFSICQTTSCSLGSSRMPPAQVRDTISAGSLHLALGHQPSKSGKDWIWDARVLAPKARTPQESTPAAGLLLLPSFCQVKAAGSGHGCIYTVCTHNAERKLPGWLPELTNCGQLLRGEGDPSLPVGASPPLLSWPEGGK